MAGISMLIVSESRTQCERIIEAVKKKEFISLENGEIGLYASSYSFKDPYLASNNDCLYLFGDSVMIRINITN